MITDKETETLGELLDGYGFGLPTVVLKAILEAYEQSKWVKFEFDDKSTWPSDGQTVLTVTEWNEHQTFEFGEDDGYSYFANGNYEVTAVKYWQPLPVFREIEE